MLGFGREMVLIMYDNFSKNNAIFFVTDCGRRLSYGEWRK